MNFRELKEKYQISYNLITKFEINWIIEINVRYRENVFVEVHKYFKYLVLFVGSIWSFGKFKTYIYFN